MKKLIILIAFACITITSKAQSNEFGLFAGGSNYIGDIGPERYIKPNNFMGGFIYKYNLNAQMALRATYTYSQLSSKDEKSKNSARQERNMKFTNSINELAVGIEYSFLRYNFTYFKQNQTPYLLLELAVFNYGFINNPTTAIENSDGGTSIIETDSDDYTYGRKTSVAIPFGVGYKLRIGRDVAMAFEIRATYTFTDGIDYNYYGEGSNKNSSLEFGNPNTNDWYVFTGISMVYAFGKPLRYVKPYQ